MKQKSTQTLYLIPNLIADTEPEKVLPKFILDLLKELRIFFVEDIRNARRLIKKVYPGANINQITFFHLGKHSDFIETSKQLSDLPEGAKAGVISEAGLPCIADPGAKLISLAHKLGIRVIPLSGPSSIILALISSGFSGQNFSFYGYLPILKKERITSIREIEKNVLINNQTAILMEAPYRNNQLLHDILETCKKETMLSIAINITADDEYIDTQKIQDWKKNKPDIHKKPAIFCLSSGIM